MQHEWLAALIFLLFAALVAASMLLSARLLRVRAVESSPLKRRTYESGEEASGIAWIQFHPRYYVVALFFVLFDVEAAFLLPWSVTLRQLGRFGLVTMATFVAVLLLGWLYAIRKDGLRWQ